MILAAFVALLPFGHEHYVSNDGAWCWFADPRAIWVNQKIVAGAVNQVGDVSIHIYDPATKKVQDVVLAPKFEKDDHDNPALIRLTDGRLAAFFTKHTGGDMYMSTTLTAVDLAQWTTPTKINPNDPKYTGPKGAINSYTYPNPQLLSKERNRIFLFWRGMNWKPTMSFSEDMGKTWSTGKIIVSPSDDGTYNRPYAKVAGDGQSKIHLAFTDGHPRNEATNSIYYLRYEKGAFRSVRNEKIAELKQLPIRSSQADVVYDGKTEGIRSWIWDVAQDKTGNPVLTYSRMPSENQHFYRYVRWDGRRWVDRPIVFGGKWFPTTPEGKTEPEPHYSGGVVIDPNDTRFVYLSRPINGRFEVERWFTSDGGDTWSHVAITGNSKHDSIRPFVVRGSRPNLTGPNTLWMNARKYVHYTDYASTIQASNEDTGPFPASDPVRAADAVFRWVRSNPSPYPKFEWMVAPLFSGVYDYGEMRGRNDALDWVRNEGESNDWKMGPRYAMADDVAVGQAFLKLYQRDKLPEQIAPVKAWLDGFIAMPHTRSLEWKDRVYNEEMAWCDALYMGPPTLAMMSEITGDARYLNRMNELWWKTSDYLFDKEESLFYRDSRYFNQKEANGKKVFWSRGNGWVLAGLANVLKSMPRSFVDRGRFVDQFRAMAKKLATLQTSDGTWHASLLDPASYPTPESSGTAFFVYGMAWGINEGLLDKATFEPVVRKGFEALCRNIDPSGRVAWIQPVGADPRAVKNSDTDAYGVGGFLMAACQIERMNRR
jgi:rhamnogalacturonyl hydrolase YesR